MTVINHKTMSRSSLLLKSLQCYYDGDKTRIEMIIPFINHEHRISLRTIDYFCSTYSKEQSVYINNISVYESFKSQIKSFGKIYFDCFCRHQKINFPVHIENYEHNMILTTVAQLCFFRWAIDFGVLKYIESNFQQIENSMNDNVDKRKKFRKENNIPPNSKSPTLYPFKSISKTRANVIVQFG